MEKDAYKYINKEFLKKIRASNEEGERLFGGAENNRAIERRKQFRKDYQAQWGYKDPNAIFTQEQIKKMQGKLDEVRAEEAKKLWVESNEFRMYSLVMYNLSGIQKGIQSYHATIEYSLLYGDKPDYQKWAKNDKTVIILDGGGSQQMPEYEIKLEEFGLPYASFCEPDLSFSISAISFLLPFDIYNFDTDNIQIFNGGVLNLFWPMPTEEEINQLKDMKRKYDIYNWVKGFRLASN